MYMCAEKFTLENQQKPLPDYPTAEREDQEDIEEHEATATREYEDEVAPISDTEEIDETSDSGVLPVIDGITETANTDPQIHLTQDQMQLQDSAMVDVAAEESDSDDRDLLPPPVTQMKDISQEIIGKNGSSL